MNVPATEMIFPPKCIPGLRDLRDPAWAQLVDKIGKLDTFDLDRLAFELLIVRWSGCVNCQADSYRAMLGCIQCASQAVRRYRGNYAELQRLFSEANREIVVFLNKKA